ncbi:MAG TPA: hypothetical protein DIT04_07140 [Dysgonomonas sp.]|nr:hypothetical protein [Dysgonomonas sp.]
MKKKYLFSALLGILLSTPIFAQGGLGADYLKTGELKVAKEIFEKQVGQSPAESNYYLGEIAYKEGKTAEAKSYYEKGLAASGDYVLNNVGLGKLDLKAGNTKAAEDQFNIAKKKDKKDVAVLVAIAEAYYDNNLKDKGDKALEEARKANKKSPLIYILEGDLKKDPGAAAGMYAQAINFDPNYTVAYIKTAQVYETVNPTVAEEMLIKAIELNPNYTLAYKMLGDMYYKNNGQYRKAIDAYQKYFAQGAYDIQDLTRYAASLYFTEQYDEAKRLINEGIAKDPNNFVLNRLLMYSYLQSKDYTNGLAAAHKFFSLDRGESEYIVQDHMTYGELLSKNDQLDKALEQYDLAIKLDPSKSTVYKEIAVACADGGQYGDAAKYYQQYVDNADQELLEATDFFNLGRYAYIAGTNAQRDSTLVDAAVVGKNYLLQADKAFSTVSERIPDTYLGYFWRARANAALDPETTEGLAKPYYEKVIEILEAKGDLGSEIIEAYRYMSYYYYLSWDKSKSDSDKEQIRNYSEKLLAVDPNNSVAVQLLDAIK